MAKIPAAQARLLTNVFVCKNCGKKTRTEPRKIIAGLVKCLGCQSKTFRPKRKK